MSMVPSSSFFPGTNELLAYPAPGRLVALPAPEVLPFIMHELSEQAGRAWSDYETVTGLGQLARLMEVQDAEKAIEHWLHSHTTRNAHETAALFLSTFWVNDPAPSASLVEHLIASLNQPPSVSVELTETLIHALAPTAACDNAVIREHIRAAFAPLIPLYPLLQKSSQLLLRHAAGLAEREFPKAAPEPSDFHAYARSVVGGDYISVEHSASHCEVARVKSLAVRDRILTVDYELCVVACTNVQAREILAQTVLLTLCKDTYRERVDQVCYTNSARRSSALVAYPPRAVCPT